jgi:SAM-dependent methyltransferase
VTEPRKAHWDTLYGTKALTGVSWYEAVPVKSLEFIRASGVQLNDPIIDVGGGASFLVEELLCRGYGDLTVLDISSEVLQKLRTRLGPRAAAVTLLQQDVTTFRAERRYALWHDRAVFHFLVNAGDRKRYVEALRQALRRNGQVIIATFGPEGPKRCSGLEVVRYDAAGLSAQLGADFALIESSLETHHTPRGASQQFQYCRFRHIRSGNRTQPQLASVG